MKTYSRVYARIDLDAIASNLERMKQNLDSHTKIMAVIKADIICNRDSHKAIIIGKDGQMIPIPKTAREYDISGNNIDGFIVSALVGNAQE